MSSPRIRLDYAPLSIFYSARARFINSNTLAYVGLNGTTSKPVPVLVDLLSGKEISSFPLTYPISRDPSIVTVMIDDSTGHGYLQVNTFRFVSAPLPPLCSL